MTAKERIKTVLLTSFIGTIATGLLVLLLTQGAELGTLLIGPGVLLTGLFITGIVTFIRIKDKFLTKFVYMILSIAFSFSYIFVGGFVLNGFKTF